MPGQGLSDSHSDERRQGKVRTEEQMRGEKTSASRETWKQVPRLSAGDVSLDFVNTIHPNDFLLNAADLIRWSQNVGLITEKREQAFLEQIEANPEESNTVFKQAMVLREASHRVLLALIQQIPPASHDVRILQSTFVEARIHEHLVPIEHHLVWQGEPMESELAQLHWLLSRSLERVLTSPPTMERVKECPPSLGGCGWLFIDKSKNSSRQWCSDQACGSLIRMRRLYARKRADKEK